MVTLSGDRCQCSRLTEASCGFLKRHISSRNLLLCSGSRGAQNPVLQGPIPGLDLGGPGPGGKFRRSQSRGYCVILRRIRRAASRVVSTPELLFILWFPGKRSDPGGGTRTGHKHAKDLVFQRSEVKLEPMLDRGSAQNHVSDDPNRISSKVPQTVQVSGPAGPAGLVGGWYRCLTQSSRSIWAL